jgi:hypothetical protein
MHVLDTIPRGTNAPDPDSEQPPAACRLLRLRTGTDADTLREQLSQLCRQLPGGGRAAPAMAMAVSVVETCGPSAADRERDALRVLDAEARTPGSAAPRRMLRATLVSVAPDEHLLLLAVAPDTAMQRLLSMLVGELSRLYPAAALRAA